MKSRMDSILIVYMYNTIRIYINNRMKQVCSQSQIWNKVLLSLGEVYSYLFAGFWGWRGTLSTSQSICSSTDICILVHWHEWYKIIVVRTETVLCKKWVISLTAVAFYSDSMHVIDCVDFLGSAYLLLAILFNNPLNQTSTLMPLHSPYLEFHSVKFKNKPLCSLYCQPIKRNRFKFSGLLKLPHTQSWNWVIL